MIIKILMLYNTAVSEPENSKIARKNKDNAVAIFMSKDRKIFDCIKQKIYFIYFQLFFQYKLSFSHCHFYLAKVCKFQITKKFGHL